MEIKPVSVTQPIIEEPYPIAFKYADKQRLEYAPLNSYKEEKSKQFYWGRSLNYLI